MSNAEHRIMNQEGTHHPTHKPSRFLTGEAEAGDAVFIRAVGVLRAGGFRAGRFCGHAIFELTKAKIEPSVSAFLLLSKF